MANETLAFKSAAATSATIPDSLAQYYPELTTRNRHFISPETQQKLAKVRILVAGCGAAGGACTVPLARLGVMNFALADNGDYELNNLNRQHASIQHLGKSKAAFHADALRGINPFIKPIVHTDGITPENVRGLVDWAEFIVDAVDVTNTQSMRMKLEMHRLAQERGVPVVCPLDLGFCQWGQTFDYRDRSVKLLGGKFAATLQAEHPIKALMTYTPLDAIPDHSLQLLVDLLEGKDVPASQLGCAADLLSAIMVAVIVRYVETGDLARGWNVNLEGIAIPLSVRLKQRLQAPMLRHRIRQLLKRIR